jgi:leucyl/phenylalanyl-tRNA--protein transferase
VAHLNGRKFQLLDTQFMTEHLRSLGAIEIPALVYKMRLGQALLSSATFR